MRPERLYLADVLEASANIALHIGDRTREEFISDRTARAAVLHELTVIGEAASRIPNAIRVRFPIIPWTDIIAFRNIVVHEYFGLSWPIVWDTATQEVPQLRRQVLELVRAEYPDAEVD